MTLTPQQREAGVTIIAEFGKAIKACPDGIPSGILYVSVCDKLSVDAYTKVIQILKITGLVEEKHHVLRWIGG